MDIVKTIELNHRPYPYLSGMTVGSLMAENGFVFNHIIVKINGKIIEEEKWPAAAINEADKVEIIHVFGGG
ncbi:MAG: sulfur carrier protein ThiS [Clostridiales bacterium]|nr:sulfur carrier protein ThiS [Clostridiales bacterium]